MTLGPVILVPILVCMGVIFLAMMAVGTAIVSGLISVGFNHWSRARKDRHPEPGATDPGLTLLDGPLEEAD